MLPYVPITSVFCTVSDRIEYTFIPIFEGFKILPALNDFHPPKSRPLGQYLPRGSIPFLNASEATEVRYSIRELGNPFLAEYRHVPRRCNMYL